MFKYETPTIEVIEIKTSAFLMASNNGGHNGWDNPHNPHYNGIYDIDDF